MTQCSTYTTPDLPSTLAGRLAVCNAIHSNKCRPLKASFPTPTIPPRLLPKHNPYSKTRRVVLSHASHYNNPAYLPPTPNPICIAASAKFSAVFNTQLGLMLHSSALAVWQYTLNATQPSMNHHGVSSLHYPARTPPHRFLKRTTKYLLNHKITHCSTYTTADLPPILAARLQVCNEIRFNKYRPLKSS